MAEPTLTVSWRELQARVGEFLGWGPGPYYGGSAFTPEQQFNLDGIVASGLRKFYFPEPEVGANYSYEWSFLKITTTLDLAVGVQTVPLPDDYGGVEGPVTVLTTSQSSQPWKIEWRNLGIIQQMYQTLPSLSGPPQYISEQPIKGVSGSRGQRFQFIVFPQSDQEYTLQMNYYVNPDYLTADRPFAYGGSMHSETILEACLSIAESRLDDAMNVHEANFQKRLGASIAMDRKNKPSKLGLNRDRSDDMNSPLNTHWYAPAGTYNGNSLG